MSRPLRVLALATYPRLAASTRHRVLQYIDLLAEQGVDVDFRPFLSDRVFAGMYERANAFRTSTGILTGLARRLRDVASLSRYDVLFIQREAALIGPPLIEWHAHRRLPVVLDLDDSTYIERPSSVYGALARVLKWHSKTARMIPWVDHVVAGNPTIARYAEDRGIPASVLPTMVDLDVFRPRTSRNDDVPLTLGWIGTHSTYAYLQTIIPVLERLARVHRFRLKIVGSGSREAVARLDVEYLPWALDRELYDLQSFDVGLYPIVDDAWAEGKSGFKSIQYLSCGIPFVATPAGVVAEIGIPGTTHFEARTDEQWERALITLLTDGALRRRMGNAGRRFAVEHYCVRAAAQHLAKTFREVAENRSSLQRRRES
jgi:glycosyltransferase involved in cell wall biosynthesis